MHEIKSLEEYFGPGVRRRGKVQHVWQGVGRRQPLKAGDHTWGFRCPAPMCFYNVTAATEKDAQRKEAEHPCPWFAGGTTTLGWGVMSDQFVKPIWDFLDAAMDAIFMEPPGDPELKEKKKVEARAYANVLAILMPPFFYHPDEIAKEAKKRWQMRQSGEEYETPGMGRLRKKAPDTPYTTAGLRKGDTSVATTLDEGTIKGIQAALESGLFTVEQLASTYKVTKAYIESLAS